MAQSQSDIFNFLITPEFDTSQVDNAAHDLGQKMEEVSKNIADKISTTLGKGFSFPSGFQPSDINEIAKY